MFLDVAVHSSLICETDIDFGFILSNSPGQLGFEMAPFKMPQDYIDILGGIDSERYLEFRQALRRCFWDLRKQADRVVMIVELMQKGAFMLSPLEAVSCIAQSRAYLVLPAASKQRSSSENAFSFILRNSNATISLTSYWIHPHSTPLRAFTIPFNLSPKGEALNLM